MTPCNGCWNDSALVWPITPACCRSCGEPAKILVSGLCGPCGAVWLPGVVHCSGGMLAATANARREAALAAAPTQETRRPRRRHGLSEEQKAQMIANLERLGGRHV